MPRAKKKSEPSIPRDEGRLDAEQKALLLKFRPEGGCDDPRCPHCGAYVAGLLGEPNPHPGFEPAEIAWKMARKGQSRLLDRSPAERW